MKLKMRKGRAIKRASQKKKGKKTDRIMAFSAASQNELLVDFERR